MRSTALPIRLLAVAFLLLFAAAIPAAAQKKKNTSPTPTPTPTAVQGEANEAGSLEQCRNGATAPGAGCVTLGGNTGWVTGNAGFQNSHWAEDQFLPYRILFSNLSTTPNNTKTVIIGYD